jgi:hypothetical protein
MLFTPDATCLEGALKIKEVSYMHSEGVSSLFSVSFLTVIDLSGWCT